MSDINKTTVDRIRDICTEVGVTFGGIQDSLDGRDCDVYFTPSDASSDVRLKGAVKWFRLTVSILELEKFDEDYFRIKMNEAVTCGKEKKHEPST